MDNIEDGLNGNIGNIGDVGDDGDVAFSELDILVSLLDCHCICFIDIWLDVRILIVMQIRQNHIPENNNNNTPYTYSIHAAIPPFIQRKFFTYSN